jgi:hypothetical protein
MFSNTNIFRVSGLITNLDEISMIRVGYNIWKIQCPAGRLSTGLKKEINNRLVGY